MIMLNMPMITHMIWEITTRSMMHLNSNHQLQISTIIYQQKDNYNEVKKTPPDKRGFLFHIFIDEFK